MTLFIEINDALDDGLLTVAAIEEQAIVGAPPDGEVVEPRVGIADAPQGDAADL